ncbi:hypothetical protein GLA29479_4708 [Lysobacter antibioticus]|uniref:hypothetical protein n=1 Tax=Lysobacter antibioticus TaxID=84531 RepID=UPI00071723FD|nr:hypothetical protein [Lysobacter antibioticus]ALN65538.1 hypothetical protein GLA29479_4708 [Lysobacter antibioticus]
MNRRHDAHDPLSPEERELAERLLRLGPHDGPSPALDAKILAAAHAAVAQTPRARSKTRWPAWIGVAASLTLAIGVAWQLRPMDKALESVGEDQATAASVNSAESAAAAPAAADAATDSAYDSSAGAADAATSVAAPEPLPEARMVAPPSPPARTVAPPPPPMEAVKRNDAAADSLRAEQRQQEHKRAAKRAETRDVQAFGAATPIDAPAPPPAPASAPVYAPAPAAAPASDAAKPQLARERRYELQEAAPAAATSAPKAEGDMRSKPAPLMGNATRSVAPAAAQPAQAETAQPAAANDSTSLDRVQVTGSRIMPDAAQEARLTPAQWLELIRGYRDRGDTELARDSLRRFHRAHPQTRVPDDLRALLK